MLRTAGGAVPPKATHEKRETNNQNETRRTEKGRRTSLHATLHSTPHITHSSMHTHTIFILFGTVSYVVSRRSTRYAPHEKYLITHPTIMFFLGEVGTHPIPIPPPRLPTQPATSQTRNQPNLHCSNGKRNQLRPQQARPTTMHSPIPQPAHARNQPTPQPAALRNHRPTAPSRPSLQPAPVRNQPQPATSPHAATSPRRNHSPRRNQPHPATNQPTPQPAHAATSPPRNQPHPATTPPHNRPTPQQPHPATSQPCN